MFPGDLRLGIQARRRPLLPEYPFEEAYFLPYARQFRAALSMPLVLLGGINRLDTIERALDEGFEFVQMGRALLREPDLLAAMRTGADARGAVHPLQQVHADDLHRHPLRARGALTTISATPAARNDVLANIFDRQVCLSIRTLRPYSTPGEQNEVSFRPARDGDGAARERVR